MNDGNIVHSTSSAATVFISTGSRPSTSALLLDTSADGMFTMAAGAATSLTSTNQTASSRILTNRARTSLWVRFEGALPVGDVAVTRGPPQTPAIEEPQPSSSRDSPSEAPAPAPPETPDPAPPETPAPAPKKSAGAERIELAIDKLPNHELIKPIPVLVESLGDKVFIAEVPDLDISITGNSMGGVLLQLKERIASIYEGHRASTNLSAEKARQLKALEAYIGKTRRNWF
jgi:hypothetical protein